MSGALVRRRLWRRAVLHALPLVLLVAITGTLAAALQLRQVRVSGARHFPASEVEHALRSALGTPTVTARPEALRELVRRVPWVADAQVQISLDGVVSCAVRERVAVAVAEDAGQRRLVDAAGEFFGPAPAVSPLPVVVGFAPHPSQLAATIAAFPVLEAAWGAPIERAERLASQDVALTFSRTPCTVVVDPSQPRPLADGRAVLTAWIAAHGAPPLRLDVRVPGRVAVLPAPEPDHTGENS